MHAVRSRLRGCEVELGPVFSNRQAGRPAARAAAADDEPARNAPQRGTEHGGDPGPAAALACQLA